MNYPEKKGDRYTVSFIEGNFTVHSFFSSDGVEYDTLAECQEKYPNGVFFVKNGIIDATEIKYCSLIN